MGKPGTAGEELKSAHRLEVAGLYPRRKPIAGVRFHPDPLRDPVIAIRIPAAVVLDAKRGGAPVDDAVVGKGRLARIVLKHEPREAIAFGALEIAIGNTSRWLLHQDGLTPPDDHW